MDPARLVAFGNAEGRITPPALLAQLRAIDPTAELVYVGDGTWWLGAVRVNERRHQAGERLLAFEATRTHPNPRNVMLGTLLLHGFARIQAYDCAGDPAVDLVIDAEGYVCQIVEDFRARDQAWRHDQGAAVVATRTAETDGTTRKAASAAALHEYLINDGRDHYRREVRDRVTFGAGGMTGGATTRASRILTLDQLR